MMLGSAEWQTATTADRNVDPYRTNSGTVRGIAAIRLCSAPMAAAMKKRNRNSDWKIVPLPVNCQKPAEQPAKMRNLIT